MRDRFSTFLLAAALAAPASAQETPTPAAASSSTELPPLTLPPGVAATVNGEPIPLDEYKDFLFTIQCKQHLKDLIAFRLLEAEAKKYDIAVTEAEIQEKLDAFWNQFVNQRHGGDRAKAERELREMGFTGEQYNRYQEFMAKKDLLLERLAFRTRVVTDELLQKRFDQKYGVGGVKVELRHIFLTRAVLVRQEVQDGKKKPNEIDQGAIDARLRQMAFDVHARLQKGEDFGTVAKEASHDPSAKVNGGLLANYNYDRYGDEFAAVVRSLKVNEVSDPFPTQSGWHIVQVIGRTETPLESAREALVRELTEEPASWPEKNEVYKRVYEAANVVLW
jgi:parvulin-like peptidyl-prolyl isomerase